MFIYNTYVYIFRSFPIGLIKKLLIMKRKIFVTHLLIINIFFYKSGTTMDQFATKLTNIKQKSSFHLRLIYEHSITSHAPFSG